MNQSFPLESKSQGQIDDQACCGNDNGHRQGEIAQRKEGRYDTSGERLCVTSGHVFAVDQFMLANSQFISKTSQCESIEKDSISIIRDVVARFGGLVLSVSNGVYHVVREPRSSLIMLVSEGEFAALGDEYDVVGAWLNFRAKADLKSFFLGRVAVDTRCMVIADLKLIESEVLGKYRQLRLERKEKAARDYLRELGATVRYGFGWRGEEFEAYAMAKFNQSSEGASSADSASPEISSDPTVVAFQVRR